MMRRVVILSAALLVVGCDVDRNTDCRWSSGHEGRELDLSSARDRRHLADDAQVAEDLAIRHADASRTPDWQRNVDEYRRVREECRARLNLIVAQQHAVPVESVAAAVVDRREWLDALVILGFAVLFALVAKQITRFMLRSALADSRALAMAMLLVAALLAGGIGLLVWPHRIGARQQRPHELPGRAAADSSEWSGDVHCLRRFVRRCFSRSVPEAPFVIRLTSAGALSGRTPFAPPGAHYAWANQCSATCRYSASIDVRTRRLPGMAGRDRLRGTRRRKAETASSKTDCTRDSALSVRKIGIARHSEGAQSGA